jgi:hypothetical protein
VTGVILLVHRLQRSKPAPEYASADVIEKRYAAQLGKLRELATLYLDNHGTTREFFEAHDVFALDEIVQAAIHPAPDEITAIGNHRLSHSTDFSPPRPDAEVGRPVVYMAQDSSCVVYRGKMEAEDGRKVWYSLTLRLEALRASPEPDQTPATSEDEVGG